MQNCPVVNFTKAAEQAVEEAESARRRGDVVVADRLLEKARSFDDEANRHTPAGQPGASLQLEVVALTLLSEPDYLLAESAARKLMPIVRRLAKSRCRLADLVELRRLYAAAHIWPDASLGHLLGKIIAGAARPRFAVSS